MTVLGKKGATLRMDEFEVLSYCADRATVKYAIGAAVDVKEITFSTSVFSRKDIPLRETITCLQQLVSTEILFKIISS